MTALPVVSITGRAVLSVSRSYFLPRCFWRVAASYPLNIFCMKKSVFLIDSEVIMVYI